MRIHASHQILQMLSALDMLKRIIKLSIHLHWAPETVRTRTDSAHLYGTGGSMHAVRVRLCRRHKLKSQRLQHYGLHFPQEVILESFCTKAHTILASGPDLPHLRSSPSDTALLQLPLVGFTCIPLSAFLLWSAPPNDVCIKKNNFCSYWVFFLCLKELQTAFPEIWMPVSFVGWLLFFTLRISHRKWNLPIKLHCSSLYQGLQIKTPNHIFNYINQHVTGILAWLPYIRPVNK